MTCQELFPSQKDTVAIEDKLQEHEETEACELEYLRQKVEQLESSNRHLQNQLECYQAEAHSDSQDGDDIAYKSFAERRQRFVKRVLVAGNDAMQSSEPAPIESLYQPMRDGRWMKTRQTSRDRTPRDVTVTSHSNSAAAAAVDADDIVTQAENIISSAPEHRPQSILASERQVLADTNCRSFKKLTGVSLDKQVSHKDHVKIKHQRASRKFPAKPLARKLDKKVRFKTHAQRESQEEWSDDIIASVKKDEGVREVASSSKMAKEEASLEELQQINHEVAASVNFSFENLDYNKVMKSVDLAEKLKSKTGEIIAEFAKVPPSSVHVQLSRGSVVVNAQIYCAHGDAADQIQKQMDVNRDSFLAQMDKQVSQIPGIAHAVEDGKVGLGLGKPAAQEAVTNPECEQDSGLTEDARSIKDFKAKLGASSSNMVTTVSKTDCNESEMAKLVANSGNMAATVSRALCALSDSTGSSATDVIITPKDLPAGVEASSANLSAPVQSPPAADRQPGSNMVSKVSKTDCHESDKAKLVANSSSMVTTVQRTEFDESDSRASSETDVIIPPKDVLAVRGVEAPSAHLSAPVQLPPAADRQTDSNIMIKVSKADCAESDKAKLVANSNNMVTTVSRADCAESDSRGSSETDVIILPKDLVALRGKQAAPVKSPPAADRQPESTSFAQRPLADNISSCLAELTASSLDTEHPHKDQSAFATGLKGSVLRNSQPFANPSYRSDGSNFYQGRGAGAVVAGGPCWQPQAPAETFNVGNGLRFRGHSTLTSTCAASESNHVSERQVSDWHIFDYAWLFGPSTVEDVKDDNLSMLTSLWA